MITNQDYIDLAAYVLVSYPMGAAGKTAARILVAHLDIEYPDKSNEEVTEIYKRLLGEKHFEIGIAKGYFEVFFNEKGETEYGLSKEYKETLEAMGIQVDDADETYTLDGFLDLFTK